MPDAIDLLKTRRSIKPREMSGPGPSPAELETILTIGGRVPDHGTLTRWRFIVFVGVASPTKYPCPAGSLHLPLGFQCQA